MNQYCYDLITETTDINATKLKKHVRDIYRKKKFKGDAFADDEKLPFIVLYSEKEQQVCIKMTSKAKKNIDRIESIHKKLKPVDLKVTTDLSVSKPALFELEQCAWWDEDCKLAQGQKWTTLIHNGPYFVHLMEPYDPHGAPIIYDGQEYDLTPGEERIASFYARRIISEQAGNVAQLWTKDKVFNKNFWTDFKAYLSPAHKKIFKVFSKLDFTPIVERLEEIKETEKQMTAKEKNIKKVKAAEKKQNYGYAMINDIKEPLGNFTIEPAAIFYGRGNNPKRGKIKRDIDPEEVIINIGKDAPVPAPAGHKWKQVIHDQNLAWVASWKDPISNENKYVYFAAEGQLKGKSDLYKYEKARKLNKYLSKVRNQYTADITSHLNKYRQLGTVLYLIDHHGIRVGNEKDESETDTVGASTLRIEHVKLEPPNTVVFDFLGKDSIRYYKEIPVDEEVYENFEEFISGKNPSDQLFDLISAADINAYLKTFDKDFSAKVFRTRLASTIMDRALKKSKIKKNATQDDKKKIFTAANIEVAKILNHQRTVSAKSKQTIKKYQSELKELRVKLKETQEAGKSIKALQTRIKKKRDQIANKKDTLNIAINTSLTNYIDPRIVISWSMTNEMNIPKAYTATLQRKFKWAIDMTEDDWDYKDTALLPEMAKLQPVDPTIKTPTPKPKATPSKPKPKATPSKPKPKATPQLDEPAEEIQLVEYSDKSFAAIGNTKPYKSILMELGGKYNPNLKVDDQKVPGWIFSKKHLANVENVLQLSLGEEIDVPPPPPVKKPSTYQQSELKSPLPGVSIIDYSAKSIAVIGDTKEIKEHLKIIGGRFNKGLTVEGVKAPGWIFSKKKLEVVQEVLEEAGEEIEVGEDVQELLDVLEGSPEEPSLPKKKILTLTEPFGTAVQTSKDEQYIVFFSKSKDPDSKYLSNFTPAALQIDGKQYPSVEHYFQAQKYSCTIGGPSTKIMDKFAVGGEYATLTASKVKSLGGKAAMTKLQVTMDMNCWLKKRNDVMRTALTTRFATDQHFRDLVQYADDKEIQLYHFERSSEKKPSYWGGFIVKMTGMFIGENTLGKMMMDLVSEKEQEITWDDIMADQRLTHKERNIIKCFGRDPNVVQFLKSELTGYNVDKKIYSTKFLARFLACLDTYNKGTKQQASAIKKYEKMAHNTLAANVVSKLKPSSVPTFMFLLFILYKVSSQLRETYLQHLVSHISNEEDIQQCLCDNADQESLIGEPIEEIPMKELYLLPSGRCIPLDELIMHLKTSNNKIQDPTYDKFTHGPDPTVVWTNGWELRAMLDRIQSHNYQDGHQIKQDFQKVLADVADTIPQQTKDMVADLYALFYFPEEPDQQKLIDMLVKHGYPMGETPGDVAAAQAIVAKGTGDQLDEFRTLIGFKLGHHIIEELTDQQREAFLFAGEFAGMGKEAWGKLSMGEFCTKTFGTILHRMSDLFKGKFSMN